MVLGLPMSTSSLSNNSLNSSGGTFNSNSSLNSTPSVDRYAALKDLDEQFRDVKTSDKPTVNGDAFAVEGTTIVNGGLYTNYYYYYYYYYYFYNDY